MFHFKFNSSKSAVIALLVCVCISIYQANTSICYAKTKNDNFLFQLKSQIASMRKVLEAKRHETKAKIEELKKQEKVQVNKLYQSQASLESTKNDIQNCESKLTNARNHLSNLQTSIVSLRYEQQQTAKEAATRINQIYRGERVSILHLIFSAQDISTFLDRVYYQKRLSVYDKKLLNDLRLKTRKLMTVKNSIEVEKNNILSTLDTMNTKKRQISASINTTQYLISKLRTNRATYEQAERELARQSATLEARLRSSLRKSELTSRVTTGFMRPLAGAITSPFGWRRHPIFGSRSFHTGVDIASSYGTPIRASNSGKVIFTGWYGGYGKVVIISHGNLNGNGTSTLYAHMSRVAVSSGTTISKGQVVGYEGTTGYSTGPHLHFEVRLDGRPTNPLNYI